MARSALRPGSARLRPAAAWLRPGSVWLRPAAANPVTAGCGLALAGSAAMIATVLLLYGLAVVVWRALRAPPLVVEYPEGAILE